MSDRSPRSPAFFTLRELGRCFNVNNLEVDVYFCKTDCSSSNRYLWQITKIPSLSPAKSWWDSGCFLFSLQSGKGSVGVRQALGETQFIQETKQFLTENGVALDSFGQVRARSHLFADNHLCLLEFVRLKDIPLVEFMYFVLTRMPGESYRQQLRCLLLCLCYVFRVLACWS